MKRVLLLFTLFLVGHLGYAQIVNSSFETWVQQLGYEDPEGWGTANNLVALAGTSTTLKEPDPSDGTYAALLQSKFVQLAGAVVPGILTTGDISFDFATGEVGFLNGVAYSDRPEKMTFDYKFYPAGIQPVSDTAGVFVVFTKYNTTTGSRDTVGFGEMMFTDTVDTYQQAEVDISYSSQDNPDSLLIVFSSSTSVSGGAQDGTLFFVDNVGFDFPTSVEVPKQKQPKLYPNPAKGQVTYQNDKPHTVQLVFFDLLGRETLRQIVRPGTQQLDISTLQKGVYLYQVIDSQSGETYTGKLQVKP